MPLVSTNIILLYVEKGRVVGHSPHLLARLGMAETSLNALQTNPFIMQVQEICQQNSPELAAEGSFQENMVFQGKRFLIKAQVADEEGERVQVLVKQLSDTSYTSTFFERQDSVNNLIDALSMAKLATYELDPANLDIIVNPGFCALIGIKIPEGSNRLPGVEYVREIIHPEDKQLFKDTLQKTIQSQDNAYQSFLEYRILKDGKLNNLRPE